MKRAAVFSAAMTLFTLGMIGLVHATPDRGLADDHKFLARFDGGIGVDPVQTFSGPLNADGTFQNVVRNFVRGVRSSTQPWRIAGLRADVTTDGRITVKGRGLLLAGGDNIGRTANLSVFATLICEATTPFVERNSSATNNGTEFENVVPLDPNGNFEIDDSLKLPGIGDDVPSECPSPLLLIRAANGAWLAAGIPNLRKQ